MADPGLGFSRSTPALASAIQGDVTLVEFFDYNCGYCRRALPAMLALLKEDPKLKFVLKELPILGPGSMEAARFSIAVRMQDTEGSKYLAFHKVMLEGHKSADEASAQEAASSVGVDMQRLEMDIASEEVNDTLQESAKLAAALNINATPAYVIGHNVFAGAIGLEALKDRIQIARQN